MIKKMIIIYGSVFQFSFQSCLRILISFGYSIFFLIKISFIFSVNLLMACRRNQSVHITSVDLTNSKPKKVIWMADKTVIFFKKVKIS